MSSKSARKPLSLALRLTLLYGALVLALIITVVLSLRAAIFASNNADFESNIQESFDRIHKYRNILPTQVDPDDNRVSLRVLTPSGEVFFESKWMQRELPASAFPPPGQSTQITLADGRWFTLVQGVREGWVYQFGLDRSDVQKVERTAYTLASLIGVPLLLLALGAGYALARAGLRPVERLAHKVQSVSGSPAAQAFDPGPLPRELEPVGTSFASVFARLSGTLSRLDAFAGDVAHELRTPLHRLRTSAELALAGEKSTEDLKAALGAIIDDADGLATLIERFLLLARLEDPRQALRPADVNVASELRDIEDFFGPVAHSKRIRLRAQAPDDLRWNLDRSLLQRAISNLAANALAHTPAEGFVDLRAHVEQGELVISVTDNGPGVEPARLQSLLDRTGGRHSAGASAGLGLLIVRRIAELHHGSLVLHSPPGGGFIAAIKIPNMTPMTS
ncbi:MAG: ATP-binding protein [Phycisphaerales bacterium]|jgi:two-component system heavy metal sensor histidine kinase CusS